MASSAPLDASAAAPSGPAPPIEPRHDASAAHTCGAGRAESRDSRLSTAPAEAAAAAAGGNAAHRCPSAMATGTGALLP
eukprot:scaffold2014_cov112-Isochrysis_galbana.AAC.5